MNKTNYILAAWSGKRAEIEQNGGYLQKHIHYLNNVKHNLSQVTIGHPYNPNENQEYTKFIKELKKLDNGTPVTYLDQPNIGWSYGHWSRSFEKYRDDFQYYIFIEDDYVPTIDNFDDILIEMYEEAKEKDNCGYLCSLFLDKSINIYGMHTSEPHAGISNGISSSDVLQKIWNKFNVIPHDTEENYRNGQILFSQAFIEVDYSICDYLDKFRSLYYEHNDASLRCYSKTGKQNKDIIVPIQYMEDPTKWKLQNFTIDSAAPIIPISSSQKKRTSRYSP